MKRERTWEVASAATKRAALALTGGVQGPKRGRPKGSSSPSSPSPPTSGAPHRATLWRWRTELRLQGDVHEPLPKGHPPPLLSEGEKQVVGGWVLRRWDDHNITSIESISGWVNEVFHITLSVGYVEKLMQELHLASKAVAWKELKFWNPHLVDELWQFLKSVHSLYRQGVRLNQIVAVDV